MGNDDWYRRDTWSDADQEHFFLKLKRARTSSRGQYLKIQAYHLAHVSLFHEAIKLLDLALAEYPHRILIAQVWTQIAECRRGLGDIDGAVEAYSRAIAQMRVVTNVTTAALLDYPLMIAILRLKHLYAEANEILDGEGTKSALFAVDSFKIHAARALMLDCGGDSGHAHSEALLALDYAEIRKSGIVYHQNIGLLGRKHSEILKRLLEIVETH